MTEPIEGEEVVALDINTIASNTQPDIFNPAITRAEGLWEQMGWIRHGYEAAGEWNVLVNRYIGGQPTQTLSYTTNEEIAQNSTLSNLENIKIKTSADFFDTTWAPTPPGDYFTIKVWKNVT